MESSPRISASTGRAVRRPWLAAAGFATLAAVFALLWLRTAPPSSHPVRFGFDEREGFALQVSPDGHYLLRDRGALEVRAVDQIDWIRLSTTDGARFPFWSQDSSAIGFFSEGRLRIARLDGRGSRDLGPAIAPMGGAWRGGFADGKIVFAADRRLRYLDLSSDAARDLPIPIPTGETPSLPAFLPEGDGFVYLRVGAGGSDLYRSSLSSPESPPQRIVETRYRVAFARDPHTGAWQMFYSPVARRIDIAPINPRTGVLSGRPVKLLEDLAINPDRGSVDFDVGGSVTAWRTTRVALPIWHLRWFDRAGTVLGTVADTGFYISLSLSPDESRVAVLQGYPDAHVWLYSMQSGVGTRLSPYAGNDGNPLWSPDGRFVYYTSVFEGRAILVRQAAEAGSVPELLARADPSQRVLSLQDISADGRFGILVSRGTSRSLVRVDLSSTGDGKLESLLPPDFVSNHIGLQARLSPDNRWLIFEAADMKEGAYASPYPPGGATPKLITTKYAGWPFFSRDGRMLYGFTDTGINGLTAQPVAGGPGESLRLGERSFVLPALFPTRTGANVGAVSRDGSKFLIISGDESEQTKYQVLTDWTSLLRGGK
jgi:hypothetical protein